MRLVREYLVVSSSRPAYLRGMDDIRITSLLPLLVFTFAGLCYTLLHSSESCFKVLEEANLEGCGQNCHPTISEVRKARVRKFRKEVKDPRRHVCWAELGASKLWLGKFRAEISSLSFENSRRNLFAVNWSLRCTPHLFSALSDPGISYWTIIWARISQRHTGCYLWRYAKATRVFSTNSNNFWESLIFGYSPFFHNYSPSIYLHVVCKCTGSSV